MSYVDKLKSSQKEVIQLMIACMNKKGITNKYMQTGVLAIVSKESGFRPRSEGSYANTSNERIRKIFSKFRTWSDTDLDNLKADPKAFFDEIYGGRYGNAPNEGYKYRGRGLNQLTFKGNYQAMNKYTESDIVSDPDAVNRIEVAVDVLIGYYIRNFTKKGNKMDQYNMTHVNDVTSLEDAVGAVYHATAGWGKSKSGIEKDPTDGYKRAMTRMNELYDHALEVDPNSGWDPNNLPPAPDWSPKIEPARTVADGLSASVGNGGVNTKGDVKLIQQLLNSRMDKNLSVDGAIGKKTIGAIEAFQQESFGQTTGIIEPGDKTWKALIKNEANQDYNSSSQEPVNQEEVSISSIKESVGKGGKNRKDDVKLVQQLLNKRLKNKLVVDGVIGKKTITAIAAFQKKAFGWADGRVDPGGKTWKALSKGQTVSAEQQQTTTIQPISLDAKVFPCFN